MLIGTDTPGLIVLEQRNQGFEQVMKKERPGLKYLVFDAKQSPTDNYNTWSSQVKAHPNAIAYVGPGSQAAVSLTRIQKQNGQKHLLVGADDLDPVALQGVKEGYVQALVSPEHWMKGYLAVKLMAQAAQSGKPLPAGLWNPGALVVDKSNIDEILQRQQSAATREAFFKPKVEAQLADHEQVPGADAARALCSRRRASARPTAASSRSPAWTSRSAPARCTRCWVRTGRASRRW